jgi:hypothetical protein
MIEWAAAKARKVNFHIQGPSDESPGNQFTAGLRQGQLNSKGMLPGICRGCLASFLQISAGVTI